VLIVTDTPSEAEAKKALSQLEKFIKEISDNS